MTYNLPIPGALIEFPIGNTGLRITGIVIGAHNSEWSGYPLLAVFTEGNRLDMFVLPETVEVLASHSDILPDAPVFLAPEEVTALHQIARTQSIKAAWSL